MKRFFTLFPLSSLLIISFAYAEEEFVDQIPNSTHVPGVSPRGCDLCHTSSAGGGARNVFGNDAYRFHSRRTVNWTNLCAEDSDGDGFTNGEELGDPMCIWMTGQANPMADITNPADPQSYPTMMGGAGTEDMGGAGTEDMGGAGTEDMGGAGTEDMSNAGTESMSNAGTESMSNAGTESMSNAGTESMSNAGTENMSNAGIEGMNEGNDSGCDVQATQAYPQFFLLIMLSILSVFRRKSFIS